MGADKNFEEAEDDETPARRVTISQAFYLGKYEVTQSQWGAVMGYNPSIFKGRSNPVEKVSWGDVQVFIKKLNQKEGGGINIVCRRRRSGNMRPVRGRRALIRLETTPAPWGVMPGAGKVCWEGPRIRWVRRSPTPGVCMICTGMSGSGRRTGMATIPAVRRRILGARPQARTGLLVAAVGAPTPSTAGRRPGQAARLAPGTYSSASA
jgi:hypothetical protein